MCGIAGIWGLRQTVENVLMDNIKTMTNALAHRGPDESGIYKNEGEGIVLGHQRLSILDLTSTGHQPMESFCKNYVIVYNGEVYNYLEIKKQLELEGVRFCGTSDTEVVVAAISKWGIENSLKIFNGMFALALWDKKNRRLTLARDQVGKKPLYYYFSKKEMYFASEIKAIKSILPSDKISINTGALYEYLLSGIISGSNTIYSEIKELEPGSIMVLNSPGNWSITKYWLPKWEPKLTLSDEDMVVHVDSLLKEAIKIRFRSDVPVGIFLSGGIDSSLITAISAQEMGSGLLTFSVGFEESTFDERPLARRVASLCQTNHKEILLKPDINEILPSVVRAYDEPFSDPSAIPSFLISQYASQYTKVIFNGDGGDEIFCGYRRHLLSRYFNYFRCFNPLLKVLTKVLPVPRQYRSNYSLFYRSVKGLSSDSLEAIILTWFTDSFQRQDLRNLLDVDDADSFDRWRGLSFESLKEIESSNLLEKLVRLDFTWSLPHDLLVKMDIATMAHSLEARSPFLDNNLVEFALRIPNDRKISKLRTKYILRKLAGKYLPKEICNAPKRGFEIPVGSWLNGKLKKTTEELILGSNNEISSMFRKAELERLLRNEQGFDKRKWSMAVWILLMLFAWEEFCYKD